MSQEREQDTEKQNINRWKLLEAAHYQNMPLKFLQLIHNLLKKHKYNPTYVGQKWILRQSEMVYKGKPIAERYLREIIKTLEADGVLIVEAYREDLRRNTYQIDYEQLAERAEQPYPATKPRTSKKKTISCEHAEANIRVSLCLCEQDFLSLCMVLPSLNKYRISGAPFRGHFATSASDCDNDCLDSVCETPAPSSGHFKASEYRTSVSSISTNQVADKTVVSSNSTTDEMFPSIPETRSETQKRTCKSANTDLQLRYLEEPQVRYCGATAPLSSPKNSAQTAESSEVAGEVQSPTDALTHVVTDVLRRHHKCMMPADDKSTSSNSKAKAKPKALYGNATAENQSGMIVTSSVDSNVITSELSSSTVEETKTTRPPHTSQWIKTAHGTMRKVDTGHRYPQNAEGAFTAKEQEDCEAKQKELSANPALAAAALRMREILSRPKV
jgi:hypothetical protein